MASVRVEREGRVGRVTIDRPPLNILDIATIQELRAAVDEVGRDAAVDILVLRGGGAKAFSAGVDVKDHTPDKVPEMLRAFHGVIHHLVEMPKVTVAAVEGAAQGGGCELAILCDLVVATESSKFGLPEIKLGCFPPVAVAFLPRRIGRARAAKLVLLGEPFSAREAERLGLVTDVCPDGGLDDALKALLDGLLAKSGAVLRITIEALRGRRPEEFRQALDRAEGVYLDRLARTEDMAEGIRSFLEKRPPAWKGR